jgi:hypothetical protein
MGRAAQLFRRESTKMPAAIAQIAQKVETINKGKKSIDIGRRW